LPFSALATLSLRATQIGGADVPVSIVVKTPAGTPPGDTPFSRSFPIGAKVSLIAPTMIEAGNNRLSFVEWTVGQQTQAQPEISLVVNESLRLVARYAPVGSPSNTLTVKATQIDIDGAPRSFQASIQVTTPAGTQAARTPFGLDLQSGGTAQTVTLDA